MLKLDRALNMRFNFKLEDITYIKILYKDTQGNPANTKAAIKRLDEKEILACVKYNDTLEITPQEVTISVVCSDGLYRTKTLLKKVENADPYFVLVLQTPQNIEYEQNREYFRVPVSYDCVCQINDEFGIRDFGGKTFDLSANGVCVIFTNTFVTTNDACLRILIESVVVELKARYVRSDLLDNGTYKVSFAFTQISEQDRDFISQVCIKKQLEHRRNSLF